MRIPIEKRYSTGGVTPSRTRPTGLEVRAAANDHSIGMLVGYAAVFDSVTTINNLRGKFEEVIRPGAFADSLREKRDVLALVEHDPGRLLGRTSNGTLRLREDHLGLHFELDLPSTSEGRDCYALAKTGTLNGMSFSFRARPDGEKWAATRGGMQRRELYSVDLLDISLVAQSAYPAAKIEEVRHRAAVSTAGLAGDIGRVRCQNAELTRHIEAAEERAFDSQARRKHYR